MMMLSRALVTLTPGLMVSLRPALLTGLSLTTIGLRLPKT